MDQAALKVLKAAEDTKQLLQQKEEVLAEIRGEFEQKSRQVGLLLCTCPKTASWWCKPPALLPLADLHICGAACYIATHRLRRHVACHVSHVTIIITGLSPAQKQITMLQ